MFTRYIRKVTAIFAFLSCLSLSSATAYEITYNPQSNIKILEQELQRIAGRNPKNVGVAFRHIETGVGSSLNADSLYFMASTYKIPMAVKLLQLVDQGKLSLDKLVNVQKDEYVSWSVLADRFNRGPVAISLSNLLELMMVLSDNTATDVLLRTVGGGKAVTEMLLHHNIKNMVVARGTKDLIVDFVNYPPLTNLVRKESLSFADAWNKLSPAQLKELEALEKQRNDDPASAAFLNDNNQDKASPKAMLQLLEAIWTSDILSEKSRTILQAVMSRCETGSNRLKGKLPKGTLVMHKTGTLDTNHGVTNNTGVITLPGGKGNIAIAVFTKNGNRTIEENEEIIADLSQAIYNYFLYTVTP